MKKRACPWTSETDSITPNLPIYTSECHIVLVNEFSMVWYKKVIQGSLMVYQGISHLSCIIFNMVYTPTYRSVCIPVIRNIPWHITQKCGITGIYQALSFPSPRWDKVWLPCSPGLSFPKNISTCLQIVLNATRKAESEATGVLNISW